MISSPLLFLNKEMPTEPTNLPEVLARNHSDNFLLAKQDVF
jgi:hypothetical protein